MGSKAGPAGAVACEAPLAAAGHEVPQLHGPEGEGGRRRRDQQGPEDSVLWLDREELFLQVELQVRHELARVELLEFEEGGRRLVPRKPSLALARGPLRCVLRKRHPGSEGKGAQVGGRPLGGGGRGGGKLGSPLDAPVVALGLRAATRSARRCEVEALLSRHHPARATLGGGGVAPARGAGRAQVLVEGPGVLVHQKEAAVLTHGGDERARELGQGVEEHEPRVSEEG